MFYYVYFLFGNIFLIKIIARKDFFHLFCAMQFVIRLRTLILLSFSFLMNVMPCVAREASDSIDMESDFYQSENNVDYNFSHYISDDAITSTFGIATNIIPWIGTIPNIEGEMRFDRHFSAKIGVWWCPWKISDKYSLKVVTILPEARWWVEDDWKGHFIGLHFNCAWYNLRYKDIRYQDIDRPALGAGITYGYLFRLSPQWGLELSFGVGWLSFKYDRFYNVSNGAKIDTRLTNYWGIDRFGVSFVYNFTK